jgi:aryl carrier-like protein
MRQEPGGGSRLVAYLGIEEAAQPTVSELRRQLQESLPDYMLPSAFVMLPRLPLNSNGKVDRAALPSPSPTRPELEQSFIPPRNEVERLLARIWSELLLLDEPGVHDNFFEVGGDSLLLIRLASRIHTQFAVDVPLRLLFDNPTLAGMTISIAYALAEEEDDPELVELLDQLIGVSQ